MANKNPTTQFNINAQKAIKALSDVTSNLKLYNKEVKDSTKNHKAYNVVAEKARTQTLELAKAARSAARETAKTAANMASLRAESAGAARSLSRMNTATVSLTDNTKAASHFMLFAAKNAARLGIDLSKAATAVRANERAIVKDTQALRDNVTSLKAFGREIGRIVKDMQLKNRTIDQQVAAAQRDKAATTELTATMDFMAKVILVQLAHRAFGELIRAMSDSVRQAQELQIRIGEIQTVSLELSDGILKTAKSTDAWAHSLLSLSRNFGISTLEQAEGIYDALSNQVVKADNATAFMASEMKLAITTVSTLNQAVDVTSTVMNAYGKSMQDAEQINAILFRGVDVGRFRLDELGSSFGRTNVLANQVGVTFEEVVGTLALLTRLGLKADVANTLLTNTFNGLIKPTEEMKNLFAEWGVNSAEAAIATFGFTGVFRKLAEVVQNGRGDLTEAAALFEDLRALTGASGLIKNLSGLEQSINDVSNATEHFNTAFETQRENLGVRGRVQLEQFKQYFLVRWGLPIQRILVETAEGFGGAGHAIDVLVITIRRAAVAFVTARLVINLFAVANHRAALAANAAASGVTVQTVANYGLIGSFRSLSAAQAGATLGLSLLVTVLAELVANAIQAKSTMDLLLVELESDSIEQGRKSFERFSNEIDKTGEAFNNLVNRDTQEWLTAISELRRLNAVLAKDFEENFKKIKKAVDDGLDIGTETIERQLKKLRDEIVKSEKAITDAKERLDELKRTAAKDQFDASINGLSDIEKIKAIEAEKQKVFDASLAARKAGEDKAADDLLKREEELREKQIELLNKVRDEAAKEVTVGTVRADSNGNAAVTTGQDSNVRRAVQLRAARQARLRNRGLGIGRPFTTSGSPPTGRTTVTEEVKQVKDAALVKKADEALALIEERRKKNAEALIKLEADLIKKKEENLAKQKAAEAAQLKAFDKFKAVVGEIDAADKDTDPAKLAQQIQEAEAAGRDAGLSGKELFDSLREANKLRLTLAREAARKETEIRLDELNREKLEQAKALKAAKDARINAEKNQQKQINDILTKNATSTVELRAELEKKVNPLAPDLQSAQEQQGQQAVFYALQALGRVEFLSKELQQKQARANVIGSGFVTPDDLKQLDEAQKKLVNVLQTLDGVKGVGNRGVFGQSTNDTNRSASGGLAFAPDSSGFAEPLVARAAALQRQMTEVKQTANEIDAQAEKVRLALVAQAEAQKVLDTLHGQYGDLNTAIKQSGDAGVEAQKRINKELDATIEKLRTIARLQAGEDYTDPDVLFPPSRANGGRINYRAFGGRGTDQQLTALSAGEFVSTRLATRQYAPLLASLNKLPPALRANGGTTVNFGDININAPEGTSSVQAADIASKLTRLTRRGLYKPKG